MKVTAVAHPIQGLIKYHGLKDPKLRLPFHDSISVCIDALRTTTTVEALGSLDKDLVVINGKKARGKDLERVEIVLNKLRNIADYSGFFKIASQNSITGGKGLGFSASGFAALGVATCAALKVKVNYVTLSELVRLGAGSATRSLAGGFARWCADKNGKSYAEQITAPKDVDLGMVIVPIYSHLKTDEAHTEVESSPLFPARLKHVSDAIKTVERAIKTGDVATIGRLAEEDTLNLHASTMTGRRHMILWEPETIHVIKTVQKMRKEGIAAWFSMDTGPSVFINTYTTDLDAIVDKLRCLNLPNIIKSGVGGKPFLSNKHLF